MRLCIDIGGTAIKCGQVDEAMNLTGVREYKTPKYGSEILELLATIAADFGATPETCSAICISSTGVIDSENGIVVIVSEELMPGFTGANIKEYVESHCGIPCHVENDVKCAAIAEYRTGAGIITEADGTKRQARSMFMMTVGTGIGGAYIENGHLMKGVSACAGEVGYIRVEGRFFEDIASTHALVQRVEAAYPDVKDIDGRWIFARIAEGDEVCIREVDRLCDLLAQGISDICCVLNPEIVVIGGGICAQREYLAPRINAGLDKYLIDIARDHMTLKFAGNDNRAGMLGACYAEEADRT